MKYPVYAYDLNDSSQALNEPTLTHLQLTVVPCQTENTTELNEWPLRTTENRNQHGDLRHSPSCLARFRSKLATERSPSCAERARNE